MTTEYCRLTVQRLFSKFFQIASNVQERWQSVDVRVTSVHCRVTPVTFFRVCFVRLLHTLAYVVFLVLILFIIIINSFRQKLDHVSPPTGMVRSWKFRHHIKARDRTKRISDFGGKIPTRWFPMGEISFPYFLREIPVKNRESCDRRSTHEKIVG